ncbi:hypothetical protein QE152_g21956 [Popillia japonica]|uniref:Uncharacterized protein n=1 Tax=Popillia japonica TaxID=7064 RepID=A0AAW1KME0_POPJA
MKIPALPYHDDEIKAFSNSEIFKGDRFHIPLRLKNKFDINPGHNIKSNFRNKFDINPGHNIKQNLIPSGVNSGSPPKNCKPFCILVFLLAKKCGGNVYAATSADNPR